LKVDFAINLIGKILPVNFYWGNFGIGIDCVFWFLKVQKRKGIMVM